MSFDKNKLMEIDSVVANEITRIGDEMKKETAAMVEGMYKGADLMYKAVKKALESEAKQ